MREAWEKVFADAVQDNQQSQPPSGTTAPAAGGGKPRTGSTAGKGKEEDFQKTIRETMERLKQSSQDSSKVRDHLSLTCQRAAIHVDR